jgi:hypothetical protein
MKSKNECPTWLLLLLVMLGILIPVLVWLAVPVLRACLAPVSSPPTPTAAIPHTMWELFPVATGAKWEYRTVYRTQGTDGERETEGGYRETIVSVDDTVSDRVRIVSLRDEGSHYRTECAEFGTSAGESQRWYVMDETHLYVTCSPEGAAAIADVLARGQEPAKALADVVAPLAIGTRWPRFDRADMEREGNDYLWVVDDIGQARVPAGTYEGCYRIILRTLPDTIMKEVCPGVGLVSFYHTHHGTPDDYSVTLVAFELP